MSGLSEASQFIWEVEHPYSLADFVIDTAMVSLTIFLHRSIITVLDKFPSQCSVGIVVVVQVIVVGYLPLNTVHF